MIYVDTSVVLATVLSEDCVAAAGFWQNELVASRLVVVEAWVRVHGKGLATSHGEHLGALLGRIALLEMEPRIIARALDSFPLPVRTLDAIHLASAAWLQSQGQPIEVATFDERMSVACKRIHLAVIDPVRLAH
jgi:predicted nucleic acid-binding protein